MEDPDSEHSTREVRTRLRIVLADDHRGLLEEMCNLLTPEFEVVRWVTDGVALIEAARELRPDVVITDMNMPEIDGLEVARQVRSIKPDLPVVLASGYTASLTTDILREAGVCDLLEKPVALPALADVLHRNVPRS